MNLFFFSKNFDFFVVRLSTHTHACAMFDNVTMQDLLVRIARTLSLDGLVKFAKANSVTNKCAREAWETWRNACAVIGVCRMFSDRCWMDAYARTVRQFAFRFANAATEWTTVQNPPVWLVAAAYSCVTIPCIYSLHYKKDKSVVHLCVRSSETKALLAVVSSNGTVWKFSEIIPFACEPLVRIACAYRAIVLTKSKRSTKSKTLISDYCQPRADTSALRVGSSV